MDMQKRFRLVDDYERIINYIAVTFSQEETTVINNAEIGSKKDDMKKTTQMKCERFWRKWCQIITQRKALINLRNIKIF